MGQNIDYVIFEWALKNVIEGFSFVCFNPSASTLNIWKKNLNKKVVTKQKFNTLYPLCMYVYLA